jgi:NADH dehydrogenase/NADH:ubiquinone oxidoreductase subunit G
METNLIKIIIDGKEIEVEKGTTILEAAEKLSIEIPTLCFHKAFLPYGACRLCTVEIEQNGKKKMVTSCNYYIHESIDVKTNTERIVKGRKIIIELLLSRCPDVEIIKDLAKKMAVGKPRFTEKDKDCILCGLCVRACEDAIGSSEQGY